MIAHTMARGIAFAALLALASAVANAGGDDGKHDEKWKGGGLGRGLSLNEDGIISIGFSGKSSLIGNYHADGAHSFRNALRFEGFVVFTAEDGAQLDARYEGRLDLRDVRDGDLPSFKGDLEVVGGTGRFRHARGSAQFNGQDRSDSTFTFNFSGKVRLQHGHGDDDDDDHDGHDGHDD